MGCNYIIAAVSLFDEYVNDLLYIREGTCLPRYIVSHFYVQYWLIDCVVYMLVTARPCYRTKTNTGHGKKVLGERKNVDLNSSINNSRLVSEQSRTLKKAITLYKPVQVY